jgi:hypothetical protein
VTLRLFHPSYFRCPFPLPHPLLVLQPPHNNLQLRTISHPCPCFLLASARILDCIRRCFAVIPASVAALLQEGGMLEGRERVEGAFGG